MPEVVGIRFKSCGKIYIFDVNGLEIKRGDRVIVESEFGLSIGNVADAPYPIENPDKELKKVMRIATDDDVRQKKENEQFERETRSFCNERIMARGLPMKLVCTEVTLDRKRIVFYFTADGRIDFRELVKDLAARFKTRIEMRQIGVRDKAKLVGGLGICGRELCCRVFLTSFEPISIKMAKQQELVLNTGKLSGVCGRLMCCLGYEYSDSPPGIASISGEQGIVAPDEPILKEVIGEAAEEPVCCEIDAPVKDAGASEQKETEDQQKQDADKRAKKRRRFRKRFHKKNE